MALTLVQGNGELEIKYELEVGFQPESEHQSAHIDGVNRVWIRNNWTGPLNELYINIPPNAKGKETNPNPNIIGKIRCSQLGKVVQTSESTIKIGLFPALDSGAAVVLEIPFTTWFSGQPDAVAATVGTRIDTTIYNMINFYPRLEFFYPDGWHEVEYGIRERPFSNLAEFKAIFTYPSDYQLGTSGHTIDIDTVTAEIIKEEIVYPQATDLSAVISTGFIRKTRTIDDIYVELLYTGGQAMNSSRVLNKLSDIITFYQSEFGSCPHDKLLVTMGYSLDATVLSGTNYIINQNSLPLDYKTLAREFSRQWFGNAINADESYETWLNESFAEYATGMYRRSVEGDQEQSLFESMTAIVTVWRDLEHLTAEEIMRLMYNLFGRDVVPPIYQPERQINWENQAQLYSRYIVGSHALSMLESAVGDSLMHEIISSYIKENIWETVNTETFIKYVSRHTSPEVAADFRLALTTNLRPDYKIADVISSGRSDRRWDNRIETGFEGSWNFPVDVSVITTEGDTIILKHMHFKENGVIDFVSDSPVAVVILDPNKKTFDANRFNNRWPRSFLLQPIYGLPSWEVYKLYYRPVIRQDWRDNWRFGVHVSGGLGLNLMPILPAFYQNNFDLELSLAPELQKNNVGLKFSYRTPLGSVERTFWEFRSNWEYPRNENSLSLSRYLGKTRYLVANHQSSYQRITGKLQRTEFSVGDEDQRWLKGKLWSVQADFVRFRYSRKQRSNFQVAARAGRAYQKQGGTFYRLASLIDLEYHLWDKIIIRTHGETGLVWDERTSNYLRYRLRHQLRAWRPRDEFVPLFRGITPVDGEWWNSVFGFGFSIGAETNLPAWPMVYIDGAAIENEGAGIRERWSNLSNNPLYMTAGLGVESQSWVEMGVYFPLWISHPVKNGQKWGWRWLVELGFYF